MSLFIGNISHTISSESFSKYFTEFGKCEIKMKGSFAFVDYDSEDAADDALSKLKGKYLGGRKINIEYSKKSKKYVPSLRKESRSNSAKKSPSRKKCFSCKSTHHFIRDCPHKDKRSPVRSSSRSRSRGKYRKISKSRSRSKVRRRRRHSYSYSRSRSPVRRSEEDRRKYRRRSKYSRSPSEDYENEKRNYYRREKR